MHKNAGQTQIKGDENPRKWLTVDMGRRNLFKTHLKSL